MLHNTCSSRGPSPFRYVIVSLCVPAVSELSLVAQVFFDVATGNEQSVPGYEQLNWRRENAPRDFHFRTYVRSPFSKGTSPLGCLFVSFFLWILPRVAKTKFLRVFRHFGFFIIYRWILAQVAKTKFLRVFRLIIKKYIVISISINFYVYYY